MFRLVLVAAVVGLLFSVNACLADGWKLVWHDEFNRDGPPDPANWDFEHGFVRNEEAQWYQPENAVCRKGLLIIEARREHKPNPDYRPDGRGWKNREFIDYTSACLVTKHKHEFTYGRIEMRARIDTRAGSWPAFWTLGTSVDRIGWPNCGEVDIMEYYRNMLLANVCHTIGGRQRWTNPRRTLEELGGGVWARRFHVWTMEWDDRKIDLKVDGKLSAHFDVADDDEPGKPNAFRNPHFLLLNQAIGGNSGGDPSQTEFPVRLEVDWVRVYQRAGPDDGVGTGSGRAAGTRNREAVGGASDNGSGSRVAADGLSSTAGTRAGLEGAAGMRSGEMIGRAPASTNRAEPKGGAAGTGSGRGGAADKGFGGSTGAGNGVGIEAGNRESTGGTGAAPREQRAPARDLVGMGGTARVLEDMPVFVAGSEGYASFRIPSLLVTSRGTLLAVCEGRRQGSADSGAIDLVLRRSVDGGRTWGALAVVRSDGANTCGNPCPVVDARTGTVHLLMTYNRGEDHESQIMAGTSRGSRTVWVSTSDDDGVTWTPAREITSSVKRPDWTWYATGPGVGIQMRGGPHSGRLIVPCDHAMAGTKAYASHVIYSDDHGATWRLGGVCPHDHTNECQVAELSGGRLLLNMRSADAGHRERSVCLSTDGGATWSDFRYDPTLVEPICQASLIALPGRGATPRLLFCNPADSAARRNLTVRLSRDEGRTWPAVWTLYGGPAAYSCLAALPRGEIGCLYERGVVNPYETITFARFRLDRPGTGTPSR